MRKSKKEAEQTRKEIVTTAATAFREHGFSNISVSDLMSMAGLTHGGFYRHFESKNELIAEACDDAIVSMIDALRRELKQRQNGGLKFMVSKYLSTAHRDNLANGCALAALSSEIVRSDENTRQSATRGVLSMIALVDELVTKAEVEAATKTNSRSSANFRDSESIRPQALAITSTMIGALSLSRIVADKKLSNEILRSSLDFILASLATFAG